MKEGKLMPMTKSDLIEAYAEICIDEMDWPTLYRFAFEMMVDRLEGYSHEELLEQITKYAPELLEDAPDQEWNCQSCGAPGLWPLCVDCEQKEFPSP